VTGKGLHDDRDCFSGAPLDSGIDLGRRRAAGSSARRRSGPAARQTDDEDEGDADDQAADRTWAVVPTGSTS
jgi:hypothetical protein